MQELTSLPVWQELVVAHQKTVPQKLAQLFAADPARTERYKLNVEELSFDFSATHVTDDVLALFKKLYEVREVENLRDAMFRGDKINVTEKRAVLHTAMRAQSNDPICVDGKDVLPEIQALRAKTEAFVESVRSGAWLGATGKPIRTIVNIGIGGSDLGPRLAVSALKPFAKPLDVRFVANVDAGELSGVLEGLDPATTMFVVVSKTFTTQETLMNGQAARRWLVKSLGAEAVAKHFVAVSTNIEAIAKFGIHSDNVFPMAEWVGGRYSLWSAVGLSIALAVGWKAFSELLKGAAAMDAHFKTAPFEKNLPALMAMVGIWYRNFWGTSALTILPYDERLRDLPRYLQQLEMESNGKSVSKAGLPLAYKTVPLLFGECGSVGQHSYHQWLHQGTDIVLADFIAALQDDWNEPEQHKALLSNLQAQAEALKSGLVNEAEPWKTNAGNKPSQKILLEKLDPYNLGLLLALYEHKTFVQGAVWDINSFDQYGVELGKKLAAQMG